MNKTPFLTKEKAQEIIKEFPTPFHIYDEKGIRENAEKVTDILFSSAYQPWLIQL